jgi:L-lactate dehydrogenase
MKVAIIGGGGRVGSCAAFALQGAGLVSEIQILDANKEMAEGEALDLLHGTAFAGDQKIYAGDYTRAGDSELFLITAGLRRKPDESRLDLINRNVTLFVQILDSIKSAGLRKDAHVFGLEPGRYFNATGGAKTWAALAAGLRAGHNVGYFPIQLVHCR